MQAIKMLDFLEGRAGELDVGYCQEFKALKKGGEIICRYCM